jgi:hypothetical protein
MKGRRKIICNEEMKPQRREKRKYRRKVERKRVLT